MNDDQPTHSGDLKRADSNHAVLNDLRNNQLILRPGEKITHTFTKSNPHAWFSYFEKLCIRYKILSDDEKLHVLIPCFDHEILGLVQPLIFRNHSYEQMKIFLIEKFTPSLAERVHTIMSVDSLGDAKPSEFLNRLRSSISEDDMSDAVLCELVMNKLPQQVQLSLVPTLGRPLLQFAAAADAAMQRLSMSSSVYSCQLQSVSESNANAKSGPSNNSNFETLLDRKFSSSNTQLQQLNQDINDLKNVQLRSSSAGTSFSSTKPRNNKIFSRPNNFAPMRSRTFSFPRYSSNFQPDSANRNGAGAKWAAPVMTKSCSPLPHIKDKESCLLFLLDSGAEIGLVKPLPHEHRNQQASNPLMTVNGAPIATFGFRTMYISFDKITTFRWIFVIADVSNNIIGADFLKHFDLSLDFASMKLVRAGCNSRWELQTKSIAHSLLALLKLSCPATNI